ncbi:recombination protein O N-terminal domain-containing protein [Candidatus Kaiserbacteria bacterium]|nr:recombination protein O N-terminal domain-containing protein [Candidatus Kaiserbacteria bacterium]
MYQKYHTEALVLGSRERGESDRVFTFFTSDFGLVRARASAVRSESSRMRYALQNYAYARVSLVRGKRGWRVAGAVAIRNAAGNSKSGAVFARIAELVRRLVAGEEQNQYLFDTLVNTHRALAEAGDGPSAGVVELVCVARILYALGYISTEALSTALFTHTAYTGESLVEAETMREKLLSSINRALAEAQL